MIPTTKIKVACLQMNSSSSVDDNLLFIERQLENSEPIDILALPENFAQMPKSRHDLVTENSASVNNHSKNDESECGLEARSGIQIQRFLTDIAKRYDVHIIAGSMPVKTADATKPFSRCLVVGPTGIIGHYDKIHLFDVDVNSDKGSQRYCESDTYLRGAATSANTQVHAFNIRQNNVRLGTSICYDLRFPELYVRFASQAANIISVPAAFTFDTGKAHWETLLKARAIETQSFVIAAAQGGKHENGRKTWGNSMVIDPWGTVIACKENQTGLLYADLDLNLIKSIRQSFPTLTHKRLT